MVIRNTDYADDTDFRRFKPRIIPILFQKLLYYLMCLCVKNKKNRFSHSTKHQFYTLYNKQAFYSL